MLSEGLMEFFALMHIDSGVPVGVNNESGWSLIMHIEERREAFVYFWVLLSRLAKDVLVVVMFVEINVSIHVHQHFHVRGDTGVTAVIKLIGHGYHAA